MARKLTNPLNMETTIRRSGEMYLVNAFWPTLGDMGLVLEDSDLEKFFGHQDAETIRASQEWPLPLKIHIVLAVDKAQ